MTRVSAGAPGREIGSVIGGVFGAVFVLVNSLGLPAAARLTVAALALVALAVVLVSAFRVARSRTPAEPGATAAATAGSPFGRRYWSIVAVEVVALVVGTQALTRAGLPELGVAWVAVVVGTHFFALAATFRLRRFHIVGGLVTGVGVAGFVLRALGAIDAIALVSGVGSGLLLLGFSLWALARG